ncbi:hypothetical protein MKX03_012343 [Papaver bracteatum]|nr:hypothetical protein MKX03_012343 [Papaver bracteatum]
MVVWFSKFLHQVVSKFEEVISQSGLYGFSGLIVVVVVRTANPTPEVVMVVHGGTEVVRLLNTANERMLGGGEVDGAIHRAAGPELRATSYTVAEVFPGIHCPKGESRITT